MGNDTQAREERIVDMVWVMLAGVDPEVLGFIPSFLSDDDPRPAREQLDSNYQHGGGYRPMDGAMFDTGSMTMRFPGDDPVLQPLAFTTLHGSEVVIIYEAELVAVVQQDGSFVVARMN